MSRIRSVHPGFFRDDRLVPCSAFARLLFIGLGVEADDKGVFEWKPVTIKMSVFPGDNVDVPELLAELMEADAIRRFEVAGKSYGAIRNFRKFQKPKTPNDVHPMADGIAEYVSLPQKEETGAVEEAQFPQKGEKSFQMEDGGGKRGREEEEKAPLTPKGGGAADLFDDLLSIFPASPNTKRDKARKVFLRKPEAEQRDILEAARRFADWWRAEQARRGRSLLEAAAFVPPLDGWIADGAWKSVADLPSAPGSQSPDLIILRQDDPLVPAIERIRGKPFIFGTRGTVTVSKAEVERAMEAA